MDFELTAEHKLLQRTAKEIINRSDGETLPLRAAVWAPDSKGLVYQSRFSEHQRFLPAGNLRVPQPDFSATNRLMSMPSMPLAD